MAFARLPGGKTLESMAFAKGKDSRVYGYQGRKTLESMAFARGKDSRVWWCRCRGL